jgi:hypothetical protein
VKPMTNDGGANSEVNSAIGGSLQEIEYLLYQSTQGFHFMFENTEIVRVLGQPTQDIDYLTADRMEKVQGLLSGILDRETFMEKRSYIERLSKEDHELLVRAYFQLVDNTILAHSDLRH